MSDSTFIELAKRALKAQKLTFVAVSSKDKYDNSGLPEIQWYNEILSEQKAIKKYSEDYDIKGMYSYLVPSETEPIDADTLWALIIGGKLKVGDVTKNNVDDFIEGYKKIDNNTKPMLFTYIISNEKVNDKYILIK